MRHVKQANAWDCGCAALAMFADEEYGYMQRQFPFATSQRIMPEDEVPDDLETVNRFGLHPQEGYQWLLAHYSSSLSYLETSSWYLNFELDELRTKRFQESALLDSKQLREAARQAHKALLVVDSWRNDGQLHWIAWCGVEGKTFDPHFPTADAVPLGRYSPYMGIVQWTWEKLRVHKGGSASSDD